MEAGQTKTSERAQWPPTISQRDSSRAALRSDMKNQQSPQRTNQLSGWSSTGWRAFVSSCTSLSQLGTKVSLRGWSICIRTSVEGGNMFVDSGKKKKQNFAVSVDRLNPTLPHKRLRKSKGWVTYCNFSLEVHSVSLSWSCWADDDSTWIKVISCLMTQLCMCCNHACTNTFPSSLTTRCFILFSK